MKFKRILALAAAATLGWAATASTTASPIAPPESQEKLIVHEWGTFTALQDERGKSIGGVNTDDEPVPDFVHTVPAQTIQTTSQMPPVFFKGWPRCDQDVLVRLETPVIYFHLPQSVPSMKLDVDVQFRGGWLTQFYPNAQAKAPGMADAGGNLGVLNDKTLGELHWHDLTIGGNTDAFPKTTERVWTAPRQVDAANIATPQGESERYLFYRGVGHLGAPLQISRNQDSLQVRSDWGQWVRHDPRFSVGPLWLVDVKSDGTSALRTIDRVHVSERPEDVIAAIPATFSASDYRADNLSTIRRELKKALVGEGLYDDEADGLLNTWEVSYFKRPGTRLFFMVPPVWTQHYLPLRISRSADITRVMVGRIELVTPLQRELLKRIAKGPVSNPQWVHQAFAQLHGGREDYYREDWYKKAYQGKEPLDALGIRMPEDYRAYLDLGRFRNALVLDELRRSPSASLAQFVKSYDLAPSERK